MSSELASLRSRINEASANLRGIKAKKKSLTRERKQSCGAGKRAAKQTCADAAKVCKVAKSKASESCAVHGPELALARRETAKLAAELAALRAQDPSTATKRKARERREETLELQAANLPPNLRAAFMREARKGTIKTTKGQFPKARWERFLEMVKADPSIGVHPRRREEPLEVQRARHDLERAEREGRKADAKKIRAYLADPKRWAKLTAKQLKAKRLLEQTRAELKRLGQPVPF